MDSVSSWIFFIMWLPRWYNGKESTYRYRRHRRCRFNPWVRKIPWSRKWQPTAVVLPENPMDRGAWWAIVHGVAELDITENACMHFA